MSRPNKITVGEAMKLADLFLSRVSKTESIDDCWVWRGSISTSGGYGNLRRNKKRYTSHRLAWVIEHRSEIPDNMLVCHHCDNPPCCNPSHLFLGTSKDNAVDRENKGRGNRKPALRMDVRKLTREQAVEVIGLYNDTDISINDISLHYGVSASLVNGIIYGSTYKDVVSEIPRTNKRRIRKGVSRSFNQIEIDRIHKLYYIENRSKASIARAMNVSKSTLRDTIERDLVGYDHEGNQ